MGLATIDPHSYKVQTELYKIPKFGVNRPKGSKKQPFENVKIYKEMYRHPDAVRHRVRMPYISLSIETFLNRYISVKTSLINTKLGNLEIRQYDQEWQATSFPGSLFLPPLERES